MWVIYSIIILKLEGKYHPLMITRKIFFYGILTLAPYFLVEPWGATWQTLAQPTVVGNLLFLGIVASLICYWSWNVAIEKLGAIRATNYLYINPIVAMITAYAVLNERITPLAMVGTALILLGVYLAESKKKSHKGE
jgi:drug/metabolite transporter (DMT)-like permease